MKLRTSQIVSKLDISDLGISRGKAQRIIAGILREVKEAMKGTEYGNVNLPYLGTFKIKQNNSVGACKRAVKLWTLQKIELEEAQKFIKYVYDNEDNPYRLFLISRESERFRSKRLVGKSGNPYALVPEEEEQRHIRDWRDFKFARPEAAVGDHS